MFNNNVWKRAKISSGSTMHAQWWRSAEDIYSIGGSVCGTIVIK